MESKVKYKKDNTGLVYIQIFATDQNINRAAHPILLVLIMHNSPVVQKSLH